MGRGHLATAVRRALCAGALGLSMFAALPDGAAQQIPSELINPAMIDQILGDFLRQRSETTGEAVEQTSPVDDARDAAQQDQQDALRAAADAKARAEADAAATEAAKREQLTAGFSPLELDYTDRLGEPVGLFGYDLFDHVSAAPELIDGAVPEDYRLGVGDEVVISMVGGRSLFRSARVDREGRIVLPEIGAIVAAGRLFSDFQREVEGCVATTYLETEAFVSLGRVRAASVIVTGEVNLPGVHQLTALSTLLDALFAAGGVKRTGSLRAIQLQRGSDYMWFDLYDFLLGRGAGHDASLRDGDRIIVPAIGPTVAVAGKVRRPAIYELAEGQRQAALDEVLDYAGGPLRPAGNRFVTFTVDATGRQQVAETTQSQGVAVTDGQIIAVTFGDDFQVGSVFLEGHVRVPGRRSIAAAPTVRALVRDVQSLGDAPYLLFAALLTHDPFTHSAVLVPVDLQRVLSGVQDVPLSPEDKLIVLGLEDIRYLWSADVQGILSGRLLADQIALREIGRNTFESTAPQSGAGTLSGLGQEAEATSSGEETQVAALPSEGVVDAR
jgi:protein involved in polysaccharide export with SLBB domain